MKIQRSLIVLLFLAAACGSANTDSSGGDSSGKSPGDSSSNLGGGNGDSDSSTPGDSGPTAGNGICEPGENAVNTPQDCPAVNGDGYCTGDETPLTAPADCPSVAGDGLCSAGENACNTPQDCPAVNGDGCCTHNETFITAPTDCPPPDYDLEGTKTVNDLLAVSPPLRFGKLTIGGTLKLDPGSSLTLDVHDLMLTGAITSQTTCDRTNGANVTVNASGDVSLGGVVSLRGYDGQSIQTASCSCYGGNGGSLTVNATNITVSSQISVAGGAGSRIRSSGGSGTSAWVTETPCNGGNGGSIILLGTSSASGTAGGLTADGGHGGIANSFNATTSIHSEGNWGAPGNILAWPGMVYAPESLYHGSLQETQALGGNVTVSGTVNSIGDSGIGTNTVISAITAKSNYQGDKLEGMFRIHNYTKNSINYTASLTRWTAGTGDLDLFQINPTGTTLIQKSDGTTSNESLSFTLAPGGETIIAVSVFALPGVAASATYRLALTQTNF